ncbi:hydrogenase [Kineobactrum sediminis]|uniref:Hydrogenase n=1 Tax=Kineobactrum sediminis TaxID=1905677 RepID=A0A2N5Y482_9GAMM|nr:cytochrome b/b6 domain-containing protein [Kineobactrum sediminis]PLW83177.1 hydrogenase [Kineobactrum sediminis]
MTIPLWDLPTRSFHWSLVLLVPLAWWTAEEGQMERHEWIGYTVILLVVFRILWGFVGSRHSRFRDFLRGPRNTLAYLRGDTAPFPGHNPLGGLSILALLALLLLQAGSGLFNSDDVLFNGPLYHLVDSSFRDTMGVVHEWAFNGLLGLIAIHLAAVAWYQWGRRKKYVQAMIRGHAEGREGMSPPVPRWRAVMLVAALALLLWGLLSLVPPPPRMW